MRPAASDAKRTAVFVPPASHCSQRCRPVAPPFYGDCAALMRRPPWPHRARRPSWAGFKVRMRPFALKTDILLPIPRGGWY